MLLWPSANLSSPCSHLKLEQRTQLQSCWGHYASSLPLHRCLCATGLSAAATLVSALVRRCGKHHARPNLSGTFRLVVSPLQPPHSPTLPDRSKSSTVAGVAATGRADRHLLLGLSHRAFLHFTTDCFPHRSFFSNPAARRQQAGGTPPPPLAARRHRRSAQRRQPRVQQQCVAKPLLLATHDVVGAQAPCVSAVLACNYSSFHCSSFCCGSQHLRDRINRTDIPVQAQCLHKACAEPLL